MTFVKGQTGFWKGKKMSNEAKKNMSVASKGRTAWNKGLIGYGKGHRPYNTVSPMKGKKHTPEALLKMSLAKKGKPSGRLGKPGKKLTEEQRKHLSRLHKGEKSHLWKGGVTPINAAIRKSVEYKLWRESVFIRDKWACVFCGKKGTMQADHIKPFAYYPELRFSIDNGRTLCVSCHRATDTWGRQCKT